MIAIWHALFLKEGIEGLKPKPKGRPSMPKETKSNQPIKEKEEDREELLEREIELLRLEVSYLKKLKAFQENPDAYLEKHKQRWHLNSSKKDLN
jgi:transposase